MSDSELPVTVAVTRPDGSVEHVRVGTAQRRGDSFVLRLGELNLDGSASAATRAAPAARPPSGGGAEGMVLPNYGRSKGMPIRGASRQDLEFYANGARRTLADPGKARFHDKERGLLQAIEAELARQQGGPPADEPPPPGDDDFIPHE